MHKGRSLETILLVETRKKSRELVSKSQLLVKISLSMILNKGEQRQQGQAGGDSTRERDP